MHQLLLQVMFIFWHNRLMRVRNDYQDSAKKKLSVTSVNKRSQSKVAEGTGLRVARNQKQMRIANRSKNIPLTLRRQKYQTQSILLCEYTLHRSVTLPLMSLVQNQL